MSRLQIMFPIPISFPTRFAVVILSVSFVAAFGQNSFAQDNYYIAPVKQSQRIAKRLLVQDSVADMVPTENEVENGSDEEQRLKFEDDDLMDDDLEDLEERDELDDRKPQRPAFGPWPRKGIRGIALDVREKSFNAPEDRSAQLLNSSGSQWPQFQPTQKVFAWAAPDIRFQPLYFEDVALERYGQTKGDYRQTLKSTVHFFKSSVLLPYHMDQDKPGSCVSPLGFCRPGNTLPYTFERQLGW